MSRRGFHHSEANRLAPGQEREVARIAKRHRMNSYAFIPDRGHLGVWDAQEQRWKAEEAWPGFDSLKLAAEILSDETLYRRVSRPAYYDGTSVPANIRTLSGAVILTREHMGPELVESGNIKDLAASKLTGAIDVRNLPVNIPAKNVPHLQELEGLLNIGGKNSQANIIGLPAGQINGNLPWSQVGTRSSRVPNFAKQNDLDALTRRVKKLEQRRPK